MSLLCTRDRSTRAGRGPQTRNEEAAAGSHTFVAPDFEGLEEWVPPVRLKVPWSQVPNFDQWIVTTARGLGSVRAGLLAHRVLARGRW